MLRGIKGFLIRLLNIGFVVLSLTIAILVMMHVSSPHHHSHTEIEAQDSD